MLTSGKTFGKRLNEQRILTNNAINELGNYFQRNNKTNIYSEDFSRLTQKRLEIDALEVEPIQFEAFFNGLINILSESLATNTGNAGDAETKQQLDAYLNFLQAKSHLGQIRTIAIRMISKGDVSGQDLVLLSGRKSLFEVSQESFIKNINPNILSFYQEKTSHEIVFRVNNFLNNVLLNRNCSQVMIFFDHHFK